MAYEPQQATSVADEPGPSPSAPALPKSPYLFSVVDGAGHIRKMDDIESEIMRLALTRYQGHIAEVARRLGIGRSTLYRKLKELGLQSSGEPVEEEPRRAVG